MGKVARGGRLWHSKLQVAVVTSRYGRWMARKGDFLKVENATSAFLATCLLLVATALGQLWRCRAFPHLCGVF
jgi:hypothetical protein